MDTKEITQRLDALAAAMVEKGVKTPKANMQINNGSRYTIHLSAAYGTKPFLGREYECMFAATPEEALDKADAYIAELPDIHVAAKCQFQRNLAKVIDEGNALSLPKDVMGPLSEGMKAMSDNLLTDQRGSGA